MYTVLADLQYPAKLASLYLDCIISAFSDELKSAYGGAANIRSRLETIENSHHFVKFGLKNNPVFFIKVIFKSIKFFLSKFCYSFLS